MAQVRTYFNFHIEDDGWNPPKEVIEEVEFRIVNEREYQYSLVCDQHNKHWGLYITKEACKLYAAQSWIYLIHTKGQLVGRIKEICQELMFVYGVTEVEAINIIKGQHIDDYVQKYYRIQHKIPLEVNEQLIYEQVVEEYWDSVI